MPKLTHIWLFCSNIVRFQQQSVYQNNSLIKITMLVSVVKNSSTPRTI